MEELNKNLRLYKDKTKATNEECASLLNITTEQVIAIENNTAQFDEAEYKRILAILQSKTKTMGKRIVKILELIFRFVATVMPLVALLLCINGYSNNRVLIILLAIGVIASSITMLPRNEK